MKLLSAPVHKSTATPTMEVYTSIRDIEAQTWDTLFHASPFAQHRWCALLEQVTAEFDARYILLSHNGRVVAGVVCHIQRRFHLSVYLKNATLRAIAAKGLSLVPPVTCGVPIFGAVGWGVSPEVDEGRYSAFCMRAIQKVAGRALFTGVDNVPVRHLALAQNGYAFLPLAPEAVLDITTATYKAYEQALPKKKREEIRRVRNRSREAGVTITIGPFDSTHSDDIERLIRTTAETHGNPYPYRPNLLGNAMKVLQPDDGRLLLAWQGETLIGTVTLFCNGTTGILKWIGLDYVRTEKTYAYHAMMTETVRAAQELGVTRLILGATVYPLKKQMGAVLEARYVALRFQMPFLNIALHWALAWRDRRSDSSVDTPVS